MALYFRAKAYRDLGQSAASRDGMQQVAAGAGRYAPDAARGLAHLARAAGNFPTALATAQRLGWTGRSNRVLGDIAFAHGDMTAASPTYTTTRSEAEQHGNAGEQVIAQAHLALCLAFTDPARAETEIAYADQLLTSLDQRTTTLTTHIAGLVRTAGRTDDDFTARADWLRAEITSSGITAAALLLDLAAVFHHTVRAQEAETRDALDRLAALAAGGDHTYCTEIAHFMAGLPLPEPSTTRWTTNEDDVRSAWHTLVQARQEHLHTGN